MNPPTPSPHTLLRYSSAISAAKKQVARLEADAQRRREEEEAEAARLAAEQSEEARAAKEKEAEERAEKEAEEAERLKQEEARAKVEHEKASRLVMNGLKRAIYSRDLVALTEMLAKASEVRGHSARAPPPPRPPASAPRSSLLFPQLGLEGDVIGQAETLEDRLEDETATVASIQAVLSANDHDLTTLGEWQQADSSVKRVRACSRLTPLQS